MYSFLSNLHGCCFGGSLPCFSTGFPDEISSTQLLNGSRPYALWVWSFGVPPFCGLCRCSLLCEQHSSHLSTLSHSPHTPFSLPAPSSSLTFWLHRRRYRSFYAVAGLHSRTTISPLSFGWRLLSLHPITNPARSSARSRTSNPLLG
jgi:hypothetical protein